MSIDDPVKRANMSINYLDCITRRVGYIFPEAASADELLAMARTLDAGELETQEGWRTEPPFPGAHDVPEKSGAGWRMICACRVYSAARQELGTIFTTLFTGRPTGVFVNAPGTVIPATYKPLK